MFGRFGLGMFNKFSPKMRSSVRSLLDFPGATFQPSYPIKNQNITKENLPTIQDCYRSIAEVRASSSKIFTERLSDLYKLRNIQDAALEYQKIDPQLYKHAFEMQLNLYQEMQLARHHGILHFMGEYRLAGRSRNLIEIQILQNQFRKMRESQNHEQCFIDKMILEMRLMAVRAVYHENSFMGVAILNQGNHRHFLDVARANGQLTILVCEKNRDFHHLPYSDELMMVDDFSKPIEVAKAILDFKQRMFGELHQNYSIAANNGWGAFPDESPVHDVCERYPDNKACNTVMRPKV